MFKSLKLLVSMPIEMKRAWEASHPKSRNIDRMVTDCRMAYIVMFGLLIDSLVGAGISILSIQFMSGDTALEVGVRMMIVMLFVIPSAFFSVVIGGRLTPIRRALNNESLGIMKCLEERLDSSAIRERVTSKLNFMAADVIHAEERIARDRMDTKVTEKDLGEEIAALFERKNRLNTALSLAASFGLSDGKPQPYFVEARRLIGLSN